MKISKQQLIEMNAYQEVLDRFIEQTGNTDEPVEVLSLIGGKNTNSDLIWLAGKTLPKEKIVRFTCDVTLINVEKIKPYADKYDLIVDFLKNPTDSTSLYAADAAISDARANADAACDCAAIAGVRAARAARAAVYAVAAARDASDNVAAYAAYATYNAVYTGTAQDQINELLIKLFEA